MSFIVDIFKKSVDSMVKRNSGSSKRSQKRLRSCFSESIPISRLWNSGACPLTLLDVRARLHTAYLAHTFINPLHMRKRVTVVCL